jgi:hypothetical protein
MQRLKAIEKENLGLCRHNIGRRVRCIRLAFGYSLHKRINLPFEPQAGEMGFAPARDPLNRDAPLNAWRR